MKILEGLKKVDSKVFLAIGMGAVGLAQAVLSDKLKSNERNELKETLKAEILSEMSSKKD